jgi:hypothetical protein
MSIPAVPQARGERLGDVHLIVHHQETLSAHLVTLATHVTSSTRREESRPRT